MQLTQVIRAAKALLIASAASATLSAQAQVQASYATGTVVNTTSTPLGYLIMLDTGRPTNCNGAPFGWMLIKNENKAVMATAMTMFALGKRTATVYTTVIGSSGHCEVDQYDPVE